MCDRLNRCRLLFGAEKLERLRTATVMVVGCGAVGSFAIEALARSGIGNIILVDFDTVSKSNINRQIFALDSTLGLAKTEVARERIADINPDINVTTLNIFFDKNTALPVRPDFVIDAIDTVQSKIALYKWCRAQNVPFISSMGAARKTDPTKIKIDKISRTFACPMAREIRKTAREERMRDFPVIFSTETPAPHHSPDKEFGSIITVTGTFGLFMANFAIDFLVNK